ncbi:MAG: hypothetical protein L6437_04370 [Kiritimatiellae bacterium]|nr:hypothetical protein [Kiritimatiellia bacterium]
MITTPTLDEIDLVVIAQNHNPSILNPDFLIRMGIVDHNWGWELVRSPVSTPHFSKVEYQSGVSIQAFFERLIFSDGNEENIAKGTRLSAIARKYIETLPHVSYSAIGVNLKVHVVAESDEKAAGFVLDHLVGDGPWKEFEGGPVGASLNLAYKMGDCLLNLAISTAKVKAADKKESPCIVFAANFHRSLKGDSPLAKIQHLLDVIGKWNNDGATFLDLIRDRFLKEKTT